MDCANDGLVAMAKSNVHAMRHEEIQVLFWFMRKSLVAEKARP